jgi:hypothetical protein
VPPNVQLRPSEVQRGRLVLQDKYFANFPPPIDPQHHAQLTKRKAETLDEEIELGKLAVVEKVYKERNAEQEKQIRALKKAKLESEDTIEEAQKTADRWRRKYLQSTEQKAAQNREFEEEICTREDAVKRRVQHECREQIEKMQRECRKQIKRMQHEIADRVREAEERMHRQHEQAILLYQQAQQQVAENSMQLDTIERKLTQENIEAASIVVEEVHGQQATQAEIARAKAQIALKRQEVEAQLAELDAQDDDDDIMAGVEEEDVGEKKDDPASNLEDKFDPDNFD